MVGLETIELLADLPAEALRYIEGKAAWHRYAAEEQVFDQRSDTLDVYFVVSGAVRILTYINPEREVTLAHVVAGNYFGELAAIDGKPRSARVVAAEESLLASIDGVEFTAVMRSYPNVAVRVLERFARIIRALDNRVTDLSTLNESQRVMMELIRLSRPDPSREAGWIIADLPSHKDLADWAGASRQAVGRTIGELARQGVVERRCLSLLVRDWPRLQDMARADSTEIG